MQPCRIASCLAITAGDSLVPKRRASATSTRLALIRVKPSSSCQSCPRAHALFWHPLAPLFKHHHLQRLVTAAVARNRKRHDHAVAVCGARVGTTIYGRPVAVVQIAVQDEPIRAAFVALEPCVQMGVAVAATFKRTEPNSRAIAAPEIATNVPTDRWPRSEQVLIAPGRRIRLWDTSVNKLLAGLALAQSFRLCAKRSGEGKANSGHIREEACGSEHIHLP